MKRCLPTVILLSLLVLPGCVPGNSPIATHVTPSATAGVTVPASPVQETSPAPSASSPPASPFIPALASIQMVTAGQGWAAGDSGVYATRDGVHWLQQFRSPEPVSDIDFIDASSGWVVGLQHLYRTIDGGIHWSALPQASAPLRTVHFASRLLGWGVAGGDDLEAIHGWLIAYTGGTLMKTTDGGLSWNALGAPANPQTVCFTGPSNGWLGTSDAVYRSTDGGRTWHVSLTRPDHSVVAAGQATLIECAGPVALWVDFEGGGAATGHSPYLAYATTNGNGWRLVLAEMFIESTVVPETTPYGPGSYPGSFSVIDPYDAVFVGDGPVTMMDGVELATHGGATVTNTGTIRDGWSTAGASFVSLSTGWVVVSLNATNGIAIEVTHDGGVRWTEQLTLPSPHG